MVFEQLREFEKDVKQLSKKYRSISEDLETVKQVLEVLPDARPPFSYRIDNLGIETCIIKVKKIACKSLKGRGVNSGLRLVYAYFAPTITEPGTGDLTVSRMAAAKKDDTRRIVFIELYHQGIKELEDRNRILKHFS